MKHLDPHDYRIEPGSVVHVQDLPTRYEGKIDKSDGKDEVEDLTERIAELQRKLYAENQRSLLVVFQAMDAAGKDSTVRHVFSPVNPAGCRVTSFKAPTKEELAHDFLWRIHPHAPAAGHIAVWNRSHYEDVLIARVKDLVLQAVWSKRYDDINAFEKLLADSGTTILKFMIHISKDYQKERLQRRLDRPDKHWKFNPEDLEERAHWDDYMDAFSDAISNCSTEVAPWYVVPAERRWFRNLLVAQTIVDTLEAMDPHEPDPTFDPSKIVIE